MPALAQNAVLVVVLVGAILFFIDKFVAAGTRLVALLPKEAIVVQGVIRNDSADDVNFATTGDFTIQAFPDVAGKFELCAVPEGGVEDKGVITVPSDGNEVNVCAKLPGRDDVYEQYGRGEYPLTLTLGTAHQRYMAQIERFSRGGLKEKWTVTVPRQTVTGRVITVCFDELDDTDKNSICQLKPQLPAAGDLIPLQEDTAALRECLYAEAERGGFFDLITATRFDEIRDNNEPPPSAVVAKVAIGIYKREETERKFLLWRLTDTRGKIRKGDGDQGGTYADESQEDVARSIISPATMKINRAYPIEGRISDASRDDMIVEMQIGRLAGVREYMPLYAYCGEISEGKYVGDIEVTVTWPHSCEGKLNPRGVYKDREALTSLIVTSQREGFR
jgi:hypothetical protein